MTPNHEGQRREQQQVKSISEQHKHPWLEHKNDAQHDAADDDLFYELVGFVGYPEVQPVGEPPDE